METSQSYTWLPQSHSSSCSWAEESWTDLVLQLAPSSPWWGHILKPWYTVPNRKDQRQEFFRHSTRPILFEAWEFLRWPLGSGPFCICFFFRNLVICKDTSYSLLPLDSVLRFFWKIRVILFSYLNISKSTRLWPIGPWKSKYTFNRTGSLTSLQCAHIHTQLRCPTQCPLVKSAGEPGWPLFTNKRLHGGFN